MIKLVGVVLLLTIAFIGSFLVTAGLLWLVCWAFSLTFSWKISFGVWITLMILRSFLTRSA